MGDLAVTHYTLGRHSDALAMQESVLEFSRRVLPADHPDIGEGHVWSAAACALLLIVMMCHFLVFLVDFFTALAYYNISWSYEQAGALFRALEAAREALRIRQSTLPPGHEAITDAEKRVRRLEVAVR